MSETVKCVLVGDSSIGKKALLTAYVNMVLPGEFVTGVFDDYSVQVVVDDQNVDLRLWDTTRPNDCKQIRSLDYASADVLILLFSLVSPTSLENIQNLWVPEIRECRPDVPIILVGTDHDLRDEFDQHADEYRAKGMEPIESQKGEETKERIGARAYIECSAKTQYNVKEVLEAACRVILRSCHPSDAGGCCELL